MDNEKLYISNLGKLIGNTDYKITCKVFVSKFEANIAATISIHENFDDSNV